ncbi:MAG: hypothetical protein ABH834_00945 [Candidatus Altiarchaeota archaeon]
MPSTRRIRGQVRERQHRVSRQVAWKQKHDSEYDTPREMVEPLHIAGRSEREEALSEGFMIFYDGDTRIRLPLEARDDFDKPLRLQGAYRTDKGDVLALRSQTPGDIGYHTMHVYKVTDVGDPPMELELEGNFFSIGDNLGHMELDNRLRRMSLGVRGASKAERSVRARKEGQYRFETDDRFEGLYRKLHYRVIKGSRKGGDVEVEKAGLHQPFDNLDAYHSIEAVDPETEKTRVFTFTIQNPREIRSTRAKPKTT